MYINVVRNRGSNRVPSASSRTPIRSKSEASRNAQIRKQGKQETATEANNRVEFYRRKLIDTENELRQTLKMPGSALGNV